MVTSNVTTIAHWVLATRQILDDVPMLQSYVDGRLRYGLALVEENQLLNGSGTGTDLAGIYTQATAFTPPITIPATVKGSFNQGTMQIQLGLDTDDAGQILLKSASLSDSDHSFLVTTQNGDKYYFQAQVMSFKVNVGSVDQITTATVTLELTTNSAGVGIVEVLAP